MSENLSEQKCPACGAPLRFDPISGKSVCDFCGSSFEINDEGEIGMGGDRGAVPGAPEELPVYNCGSCGAQIITEAVSASVQCPYCGNNIVLTERVSGSLAPDGLIPFRFDKKQLPDEVKKFYKNKKLLPGGFFSESSLEEVAGVYVPFWLFDSDLSGRIKYDCTRERKFRDGDYEVTETEHYDVVRDVSMRFENVPVNASTHIDETMMDSVEPFDYSGLKPFSMSYLSGFFADRFDKASDSVKERADSRMRESAFSVSDSEAANGYGGAERVSGEFKSKNEKRRYMLLPVYTFGVKWREKMYNFAMNGQTGKVVGDIPTSMGKFWLLWGIVFAAVYAASLLLIKLISDWNFWLPAVIGLIVAFIVALVEKSKMKTVRKAVGARDYLLDDSVVVKKVMDRFSHTEQTRSYSPEKKD